MSKIIFSQDGKFILSQIPDSSYSLWERSSGNLVAKIDEKSNYVLTLCLLFNKNINKNYQFICSQTLSANETRLSCTRMMVINSISLSEENCLVFREKNAFCYYHLEEERKRKGLVFKEKNEFSYNHMEEKIKLEITAKKVAIKKTCKCIVLWWE